MKLGPASCCVFRAAAGVESCRTMSVVCERVAVLGRTPSGGCGVGFARERLVRSAASLVAVARANGWFVRRRCWLLLVLQVVLLLVLANF